jgi:hypothetical protein
LADAKIDRDIALVRIEKAGVGNVQLECSALEGETPYGGAESSDIEDEDVEADLDENIETDCPSRDEPRLWDLETLDVDVADLDIEEEEPGGKQTEGVQR